MISNQHLTIRTQADDGIYQGGVLSELRPVVLSKLELYNVNLIKISYFCKNNSVRVYFHNQFPLLHGDVVKIVNTPNAALDGIYLLVETVGQIAYMTGFDKISDIQADFSLDGGELIKGYRISEMRISNGFIGIFSLRSFDISSINYATGTRVFLYTHAIEYADSITFSHLNGYSDVDISFNRSVEAANYYIGEDIFIVPKYNCPYSGWAKIARINVTGWISFSFAGGEGFQPCGISKIVRLSKTMLTGAFTVKDFANQTLNLAESTKGGFPSQEVQLRNVGYLFI